MEGAAERTEGVLGERSWHRHYDPGVPPRLDFEPLALPDFLERSAMRFPQQPALHFLTLRQSYRELRHEVSRCAAALAALGVERGTRVAIQLPNLPQAVIAFQAVLRLGAQAVMTNPLYTPREIEHQWNDSDCRVAVVADYLWEETLEEVRHKVPVEHYLVASIPEYLPWPVRLLARWKLARKAKPLVARVPDLPGVHAFRPLLEATRQAPPDVPLDPDELAIIQYTGGTTGVSKGAMLSHRNLSANVQQIHAWFTGVEEGAEVVLSALPLFHVFGLTVGMNWPLYAGAALVLLPDPRDVRGLVKVLESRRVSIVPAVPTLFNAINHFAGIEGRDLSSVKYCFSGSAPLPTEVQTRFESLTGSVIVEGFGLTETSPVTHVNPLAGERKIGSIGLPVSDTDARIVDVETGERELGVGEEGELLLSGPQVMSGYWNRPEETQEALRDGWFATGDLATVDEEGYFRIVGRKKDMIIAGGYNIYPDEIDNVLMAHPEVHEAATIGVPHERRGETVKSFVVRVPGSTVEAATLEAYCREQLAPYKVPRAIEFLEELPKSTVMKVLRRELRERELERLGRSPS